MALGLFHPDREITGYEQGLIVLVIRNRCTRTGIEMIQASVDAGTVIPYLCCLLIHG